MRIFTFDVAPKASDPSPTRPTVERVLALVAERARPATTAELAEALNLHVNGVRRHLERLEAAGRVEKVRVRHGRGRPRDAWTLSTATAYDPAGRYAELARWLARAAPVSRSGERAVERAGRGIGRELAEDRGAEGAEGFRGLLVSLGFQPSFETSQDGKLRCRLCHCPYADAVRENPDLVCGLHQGMTAGMLERLAPRARLAAWESRDPEDAGCTAEIEASGWTEEELSVGAGGEPQ